jgi:hypothetical protein
MITDIPSRKWLAEQGISVDRIPDDLIRESEMPPDNSVYRRMPLPSMIVVHHSATDSGSARLFRCLHKAVNGWEDIGYHFVIGNGTCSGDGEVEEGRPIMARGAHARGSNHCSLGVCLVGNFEVDHPSVKQIVSLGSLLNGLLEKCFLSPECITLHRLVKGCSTACPGRNLTLDLVRESLESANIKR